MSACSAASHRPILASTTRWVSRVLRLDRRGGVPAFDRVRPARGGAGDGDGPLPVSRCRWRTGVAERGQGPVNAVQVAAVEMPFDRLVRAQSLQRR